jgi:hypothetical protein
MQAYRKLTPVQSDGQFPVALVAQLPRKRHCLFKRSIRFGIQTKIRVDVADRAEQARLNERFVREFASNPLGSSFQDLPGGQFAALCFVSFR